MSSSPISVRWQLLALSATPLQLTPPQPVSFSLSPPSSMPKPLTRRGPSALASPQMLYSLTGKPPILPTGPVLSASQLPGPPRPHPSLWPHICPNDQLSSSLPLPDLTTLANHITMLAVYRALQRKAYSIMVEYWRSFSPVPACYNFPLLLSPHPFMGLRKFIDGRIHQMRAQMSYLAAHPAWYNSMPSRLCPPCGDEQEIFSYTLLHCWTMTSLRLPHLHDIASVALDTLLWSSPALLLGLASYIKATSTNFPPDILPDLLPSPASKVFPSST